MDDEIRLLRIENARLVRENAQKDREFLQMKEILTTAGNHLLAVAEPLRQAARGMDDVNVQLMTNIPAILMGIGDIKKQSEKKDDTAAIKLWDRFAAAPARVQWTVVVIFGALAVSGWAVKIVEWAIGK